MSISKQRAAWLTRYRASMTNNPKFVTAWFAYRLPDWLLSAWTAGYNAGRRSGSERGNE